MMQPRKLMQSAALSFLVSGLLMNFFEIKTANATPPIAALDSLAARNHLGTPAFGGRVPRIQMIAGNEHLVSYFLESSPSNIEASTLPKTAREIVVARVRISGRPAYLVGRRESGVSPSGPPPRNLFHARLNILDVRSGNAAVGSKVDVTFGVPSSSNLRNYHPYTPVQLERDYFVVMYVDDDGRRRLAGFAISETQYRDWEVEVREYDRPKGRPRAPR